MTHRQSETPLVTPSRPDPIEESVSPPVEMIAVPSPKPPEDTPPHYHRDVWRLAWPSVTAMLLQTVNGLLDVFFVGHLPNSQQALAATGIGAQALFLLISLAMGISVGTSALVARFTGAQDRSGAITATAQSLTLAAIMGSVCFVVFLSFRGVIAGWMLPKDPAAAALCAQFLSVTLLAAAPIFLLNVLMGMFRGLGDTRTPLLVQIAIIFTHITGNLLLINGNLGFPALGVRGAGIAMALSIYVGTALFILALVKRTPLADALRWSELRPDAAWARRILRIGLPAAAQAVIRQLSMMSFTSMLGQSLEGAAGVAALQIGLRVEALAFMPGFGYSVAATALVGQSLGANAPERAERYGWTATWQAVGIMSGVAVLFYAFAVPISHQLTGDPTVQHLSAAYLRTNAICEPFLALGMVLTGALQGAGDTVRPAYITIFSFWGLRIPLAYWLMFSLDLQTYGAWWAMAIATIVGGLLTAALFYSGKWKRIQV